MLLHLYTILKESFAPDLPTSVRSPSRTMSIGASIKCAFVSAYTGREHVMGCVEHHTASRDQLFLMTGSVHDTATSVQASYLEKVLALLAWQHTDAFNAFL